MSQKRDIFITCREPAPRTAFPSQSAGAFTGAADAVALGQMCVRFVWEPVWGREMMYKQEMRICVML